MKGTILFPFGAIAFVFMFNNVPSSLDIFLVMVNLSSDVLSGFTGSLFMTNCCFVYKALSNFASTDNPFQRQISISFLSLSLKSW